MKLLFITSRNNAQSTKTFPNYSSVSSSCQVHFERQMSHNLPHEVACFKPNTFLLKKPDRFFQGSLNH